MSSDNRGLYIIRDPGTDESDEDAWVAPEPAESVIVDDVLAATDLDRDDVEPLGDHVDFEALEALLTGDDGTLSFTVAGYEVTVAADGSVSVTDS